MQKAQNDTDAIEKVLEGFLGCLPAIVQTLLGVYEGAMLVLASKLAVGRFEGDGVRRRRSRSPRGCIQRRRRGDKHLFPRQLGVLLVGSDVVGKARRSLTVVPTMEGRPRLISARYKKEAGRPKTYAKSVVGTPTATQKQALFTSSVVAVIGNMKDGRTENFSLVA